MKVKAHTQYIEDGDYIICIVGAPDKSLYRMMSSNTAGKSVQRLSERFLEAIDCCVARYLLLWV